MAVGGAAPLFCFVALHSCTSLKPDGETAPSEVGPPDANGSDTGSDAGSADATGSDAAQADTTDAAPGGSLCEHRGPPAPPTVVDAGGTLDLLFAVKSRCIGSNSPDAGDYYKNIGFDLDDTCTGEGQDASCVEPPIASVTNHNDGVDGIDNSEVQSDYELNPLAPPVSCPARNANEVVALIRVRYYTGTSDDDQVEVSRYFAFPQSSRPDGGTGPQPEGGPGPQWDGLDQWTVIPETLADPGDGGTLSVDHPRYVDKNAYVVGGTLVAQFDAGAYPTGLPFFPLVPLSQEIVVGQLDQPEGGTIWELRNVVEAGRFPIPGILKFFGYLPSGDDAGHLTCQSAPAFHTLVNNICRFVDISSVVGSPPSAPCDALSAGEMVQATQAMFGGIGPPATSPPPCDPTLEPTADSCTTVMGP